MKLQSEFSREFLKTIFARLPPLASAARCGPHLPRYASELQPSCWQNRALFNPLPGLWTPPLRKYPTPLSLYGFHPPRGVDTMYCRVTYKLLPTDEFLSRKMQETRFRPWLPPTVVRVTWLISTFRGPGHISGADEARHFKFGLQIEHKEYWHYFLEFCCMWCI